MAGKQFASLRSWTKRHFSPNGYYALFRSYCDTLFPTRAGSVANSANFYSVDEDFYGRLIAREFVGLDDCRHELAHNLLDTRDCECVGEARRSAGIPDCSFMLMYVTACVSFDHVHFWNRGGAGQSNCTRMPACKNETISVSIDEPNKLNGGSCCGCCTLT